MAKNLEETKPTYRLDHIIKERFVPFSLFFSFPQTPVPTHFSLHSYPTFVDSLRDLDDAISLIVLFAALPATTSVPASIIANCARLAAEWQLYVLRTRSLRKVFLSIKGIYFQAEIQGQTITWLVPYMFTQNIPSDLDYRIMLTFLELYQTLLGFSFFKLYTDINLVYPPKLDDVLDENGAGIGALLLEEAGARGLIVDRTAEELEAADEGKEKKRVYAKDVRAQIKEIEKAQADTEEDASAAAQDLADSAAATAAGAADDAALELDVFTTPAGNDASDPTTSVTQPSELTAKTDLFAPYFFYLSREVTRPTLEFIIRSFGGRVGWDAVLGAGSPYKEDDPRITHHVLDRPVLPSSAAAHPGKRAYVQPQWVVDCLNKKVLLPTDEYKPGAVLPPHLSPFIDEDEVRERGGYVPTESALAGAEEDVEMDSDEDDSEEEEEEGDDEQMEEEESAEDKYKLALLAAASNPSDDGLRHAAELEAEARGVAPAMFEAELASEAKKAKKVAAKENKGKAIKVERPVEETIAASLLTNKQRKLYNKMSYSADRKKEEVRFILSPHNFSCLDADIVLLFLARRPSSSKPARRTSRSRRRRRPRPKPPSLPPCLPRPSSGPCLVPFTSPPLPQHPLPSYVVPPLYPCSRSLSLLFPSRS